MYVCICMGITDNHIRQSIISGESNSLRDVRNALGAMTQCGKCALLTKQIVDESLKQLSPSQTAIKHIAVAASVQNDDLFYEVG